MVLQFLYWKIDVDLSRLLLKLLFFQSLQLLQFLLEGCRNLLFHAPDYHRVSLSEIVHPLSLALGSLVEESLGLLVLELAFLEEAKVSARRLQIFIMPIGFQVLRAAVARAF